MFLRMLCTAVVLLFAILAFCGFGPMPSVWGRVSFGLGFLLIKTAIGPPGETRSGSRATPDRRWPDDGCNGRG
jgi:hypothetical protein